MEITSNNVEEITFDESIDEEEDIDYLCDTLKEFNLVIFIDENGGVISGSGSLPLKIQLLY